MLAILAERLEKRFPPDIHAVDGVDLAIEEGPPLRLLGC